MIKSKKDPLPDSEILKEYQSVIRKLQEELYSLKNSQAVQDEIFKTMRESELELQEELVSYSNNLKSTQEDLAEKNVLINDLKSEVKSLYEQLKAAKEENLDLLKEIEYLKDSLSTDSIYEFFPGSKELSQKISACQTLRKNAENNAEFFKDELEKKVEEVKELRKEVEKMKEENQNTFRKDELKKIVILKDEQMKSLNKRFQVMVSKLDSLLKEKENWENEKKTLENEKKKLSERWQQSSSRNKSENKLLSKNKQLDSELHQQRSEIDFLTKKNQELYQKHISLQQSKDSDGFYIEKLKDELLKLKTRFQILQDERDILAKINEELSVNNHLKEMQINSAKSISRPPDEYKFAVEMNVSLEHKLEKCQAEIFSLKHQLSRKNEELARLESEISSIKEKSMFSKDLTHEFHEFSPRYAETSCFVEDFKGLLEKFRKSKEKYKRCKGEKREIFANFERMKERVIQLSAQVQSDQYLIKHLKEKGSRFDKGLADSRSSSSLRLKMNKEL